MSAEASPRDVVALLGGVNVGGVRVPMAELRRVLADDGFADVRTVLASGNVLLRSALSLPALERRVETLLGAAFRYRARVLVLENGAVRAALDGHPFAADPERNSSVVFATGREVVETLLAAETDPESERVADGGTVVHWQVRRGRTTETPFAKALASAAVRTHVTTRNVRTLEKILAR